MAIHVVIPDTQARMGTPTDHLDWIGRYIVEHYAGRDDVTIIHLGDHWDFPSLSSYDRGKRQMEGRRIKADIEAGNEAFRILNQPLEDYNEQRKAYKEKQWWPRRILLRGNHEDRLKRYVDEHAQLDGFLTMDALESPGWEIHGFLEPVIVDGLAYSHFFVNNANGKPISGMIETRIKNVGMSFVQGHQQGLRAGMVEGVAGRRRGIVAGSCYLSSEEYRGPQGRGEWRGILVLHEVADGDFDLMEVSLSYLCRRYTGLTLGDFYATLT